MKAKKLTYVVLFLLIPWNSFAQEPIISAGLWKLTRMYGNFNLSGFYRGNERSFNQFNEFHQSTYFSGGICLKTKSYLFDPKFMTLDVDVEYSPETGDEQYLTIPDRSEVRTLKKLDIRTIFFKQKDITLNAYVNFNQNINTRELLTDIKTDSKRWGGMLSYKNKVIPFSMSYNQNIWNQEELASGRVFKMDQKNFLTRATKSFSKYDSHELTYSHNMYFRQDGDMMPVENDLDNIFLKNTIHFDSQRKYNFRSRISYFNQYGNINFSRLRANESLLLKLPKNLTFLGNYEFYKDQRENQRSKQNGIRTALRHQLYLSLKTNIYFEHFKLDHSVYDETNSRAGIDFNYTKKIPANGRIILEYRYYRQHQITNAQSTFINVINEEQVLTDGQITILNRPYIDPATIVVKDITTTIIYQLNLDYLLIERNNFIEIQRIPGGQIPNNETVYIDYTALQPGSYQFDANNNAFSANVRLFGKLIELYIRASIQDYSNLINVDHITLNEYTQIVFGGKVDVGIARIGVEYDNYNSNIIPYRMIRYYIHVQKTFYKRLMCSLNGNIRNYEKTVDKIPQQFADISAKVAYSFRLRTKVSLDVGYRKHQGDGIDLELLTGRGEFITTYRQMTFKAGIDMYRRDNLGDKTIFNNVYGKIIRKFKL